MFIVSRLNFKLRRADGSIYRIAKDFMGDIPDDVAALPLVQAAMRDGSIMAPDSHADKALQEAGTEADEKAAAADIRPDAKRASGEKLKD